MAPADPSTPAGATLTIQVAHAPQAGRVDIVALQLPPGATVGQAVARSGLLERYGLRLDPPPPCGVWAKLKPLDHPLREGDRVEIYRPLKVDPKEARRQRYRRNKAQGR